MKARSTKIRREPPLSTLFAAAGVVLAVAASVSLIAVGTVGGVIYVCVKVSELVN